MIKTAPTAAVADVGNGRSHVSRVTTHSTTKANASWFMMIAAIRRKRRNPSTRPKRCVYAPVFSWRRNAHPTNSTYAIRLRMAYAKIASCAAVTLQTYHGRREALTPDG